jgi:hypothetical protein
VSMFGLHCVLLPPFYLFRFRLSLTVPLRLVMLVQLSIGANTCPDMIEGLHNASENRFEPTENVNCYVYGKASINLQGPLLHPIFVVILIAITQKLRTPWRLSTNLGLTEQFLPVRVWHWFLIQTRNIVWPLLRNFRMIRETQFFAALRMATMISRRQEFPDNIVRCGHGRLGFVSMR